MHVDYALRVAVQEDLRTNANLREAAETLAGEVKRQRHIIDILRRNIELAHKVAGSIDKRVRWHDDRVEIWSFGGWVAAGNNPVPEPESPTDKGG